MENIQRFDRAEIIFISILWGHSHGLSWGWGVASLHTLWGQCRSPTPPHPYQARQPPFHSAREAAQETPAETAFMCVSKLPQLSGHVESYSFALHEKLKSCPGLMEGNR